MTTRIRLTVDGDISTDSLEQTLTDALGDDELETDRASGPTERETLDETTEVVATRYLADTVDPTDTVDELQNEYPDAEIDTSRQYFEYEKDEFADDLEYYPYDRETGLRTPVEYQNNSGYDLGISTAVVVGGTESTIDDSVTFAPVTDYYTRRDRVVTDGEILTIIKGDPTGNPKESGKIPESPDAPTDHVSLAVVTLKEHIDRIPHGAINVEPLI